MTTVINLMEAYIIETLLSKGMSKTDLIHSIKTRDIETFKKYDQTFDYNEFLKANTSHLIKAIESDYTVKFLTRNGIIGLLELKYGKKKNQDYQFKDSKLIGIKLTEEQLRSFELLLSQNWTIVHKKKLDSNRYIIDVWNVVEQRND